MDLMGMDFEGVDLVHLAQDKASSGEFLDWLSDC
jgi:hypothetical protein